MSRPPIGQLTVLLVEDDPTVRLLESRVLRSGGYAVLDASNGHQALALAASCRPALIVLDISLPSISGLQVLEQLAAEPSTCGIPVLVVSSYAALISEQHRPRMAALMAKPVDASAFLALVRTLVDRTPRGLGDEATALEVD